MKSKIGVCFNFSKACCMMHSLGITTAGPARRIPKRFIKCLLTFAITKLRQVQMLFKHAINNKKNIVFFIIPVNPVKFYLA